MAVPPLSPVTGTVVATPATRAAPGHASAADAGVGAAVITVIDRGRPAAPKARCSTTTEYVPGGWLRSTRRAGSPATQPLVTLLRSPQRVPTVSAMGPAPGADTSRVTSRAAASVYENTASDHPAGAAPEPQLVP